MSALMIISLTLKARYHATIRQLSNEDAMNDACEPPTKAYWLPVDFHYLGIFPASEI